jgi:type IV secretory pathway VirJ component
MTAALLAALCAPDYSYAAAERRAEARPTSLVVRPATQGTSDTFAIMLTGDGGWRRIDVRITDVLRGEGMPVVGLLTNDYFAQRRTPEEAAAFLETVIRDYGTKWNKPRVILIGYSRGADVLPFLINRLTPATRDRINGVALLGLETSIDFKYHPSWIPLYRPREPQFAVLPEVEKLRGLNVLCVYGEQEKESLCRSLPPQLARVLRMPGRHHFAGRYSDVAKAILKVSP